MFRRRERAWLYFSVAGFALIAVLAVFAAAPDDGPSALMLTRARILAQSPPAAGWDGVWDSARAA